MFRCENAHPHSLQVLVIWIIIIRQPCGWRQNGFQEDDMSVNVEINLPEGKSYRPSELLFDGLEYGIYDDNYLLREASGEESSVIVFDPAHIGRGICIEVGEDKVSLDLASVTGTSEIKLFYELIKHICGLFKTTVFSREGQLVSLGMIDSLIEGDIKDSGTGLTIITKKLENGSDRYVTLFGALNPLLLGLSDLKELGTDAEKLGTFLHEKQSVSMYYAGLQLYSDPDDGSLIGVYPFPADTYSVMPYEPIKPFYLEQDVDKWMVYLYVSDSLYGYIPFDDFSKHVRDLGRYDEMHYFCEVDRYQARGLIEDLAVKM